MKDIEWIFFDVGGVLVDNSEMERWRRKKMVVIAQAIDPTITTEDVDESLEVASSRIGNLGALALQHLLRKAGRDALEAAQNNEKGMWSAGGDVPAQPIRKEALRVCAELSHRYKLGIIANQPRSARAKLERAGILQYFSHVGLSEEINLHKPDIRLFTRVLKESGADPARSAMIDDNYPRGLVPAAKLGIMTVWLRLSHADSRHPADYQILNLEELLNIF